MDPETKPETNQQIFRKRIGRRIAAQRRKHGWSQRQLAERVKVPRGRLSKWEAGYAAPPPEDQVALSEVLGITVDELLTGRPMPLLPKELSAEARAQIAVYLTALLELLDETNAGRPQEIEPSAGPGANDGSGHDRRSVSNE